MKEKRKKQKVLISPAEAPRVDLTKNKVPVDARATSKLVFLKATAFQRKVDDPKIKVKEIHTF